MWTTTINRILKSFLAPVADPRGSLERFVTRIIFLGNLQDRMIYRSLPAPIDHILLVCTGNICRSPLAAAYISARLTKIGRTYTVQSAGLETSPGKPAHPLAILVAKRHGLCLDRHATKPLSAAMVKQAHLILVMELSQRTLLLKRYPEATGKVFVLGHFDGVVPLEITDPYNGTEEDFEKCYELIRLSSDRLLDRIQTHSYE
ncbi:MAG: low molecular weight protein-tyrosine-phosphatase, partial [Nitrososphaera sp.]